MNRKKYVLNFVISYQRWEFKLFGLYHTFTQVQYSFNWFYKLDFDRFTKLSIFLTIDCNCVRISSCIVLVCLNCYNMTCTAYCHFPPTTSLPETQIIHISLTEIHSISNYMYIISLEWCGFPSKILIFISYYMMFKLTNWSKTIILMI